MLNVATVSGSRCAFPVEFPKRFSFFTFKCRGLVDGAYWAQATQRKGACYLNPWPHVGFVDVLACFDVVIVRLDLSEPVLLRPVRGQGIRSRTVLKVDITVRGQSLPELGVSY